MKIVFIAGLGHSGSTILDMALGCHKNMIGLGEVFQIVQAQKAHLLNHPNFNDAFCSCGRTINACEFWKHAKQILIDSGHTNPLDRFLEIARFFEISYGADMILVDSSKNPMDYWLELNKRHDVKIIHLVRDVRGWVYSRHSRLRVPFFKLAYLWLKGNWNILRFLKNNNLDYRTFGYEEIALYPEEMMRRICGFIGIAHDPDMLVPDKSKSHVFQGNVAKGDNEKRSGFLYDARWFTSLSFILLCPMIFPLFIVNRRLVYSNFMKGKTTAFGHKQPDFLIFGNARKEDLVKNNWGVK